MFAKNKIALSALSMMALALFAAPAQAVNLDEKAVAAKFKKYKTSCFELLDCQTGEVFRFNKAQCGKRLPPQSTFKIFNALAGLESGVLKDENHFMKWDGTKHELEPHNRDQTLSSAMKDSVVWYFQRVAQEVGEEKMKAYVQATHYGNDDTSGGITRFWIDDGMKISADEQVEFVKRLYYEKLPFSKRSIDIVKKVTELKETPRGELHGKTGSSHDGLGWFVGYVVHEGHPYVFASNIQAPNVIGRNARMITESILQDAGLL